MEKRDKYNCYVYYIVESTTHYIMEKKTVTKDATDTPDAIETAGYPVVQEEQNVFHKTKIVINAIKYLKKVIQKLSKDEMDTKNKQKLFLHYNDLVDVIIAHSKQIEIDKLTIDTVMDV